MSVRQCLVPICLLASCYTWAGQLTLKSGDSITGDLRGIEGDKILWRSPELGDLGINKGAVKSINADNPLKIRGKDVPCMWLALLEDEKVVFRCADGDQPNFPLLTLKHVLPFAGHRQANFAFTGDVRASGWQQRGNTEGKFWEFNTRSTLRHSDIRHILNLTFDGQQTESYDANTNTVNIDLKKHLLGVYTLDWFFLPQWYWTNKISGERDDNRNIQEEYIVGTGLGYQFWETHQTALSFEAGLDKSSTYLRLNPLPNEPEEYTSVRLTTDFRYTFVNRWNIYNKNEYTQAINDLEPGKSDRWRFKTDTGMQFPIGFGISANFSVKWDYVNYAKDLDPNASRADTTYRVGLNYTW